MGADDLWFYSTTGDTTSGPVPTRTVRELFGSGALALDHFVRHAGWDQWYSVRDCLPQLGLDEPRPVIQPVDRPVIQPVSQWESDQDAAPTAFIAASAPASVPYAPPDTAVSPAPSPAPAATVADRRTVTPLHRLGSWAIDLAVLVLVSLLIETVLPNVFAMLVIVAAVVGYLAVLPAFGWHTLGHIALGLRVARADDEANDPFLVFGARTALIVMLSAPCLVGFVASACSMWRHQRVLSWHDVGTGTVMVRVAPMRFGRAAPLLDGSRTEVDQ